LLGVFNEGGKRNFKYNRTLPVKKPNRNFEDLLLIEKLAWAICLGLFFIF
jgi:hypothetical protein